MQLMMFIKQIFHRRPHSRYHYRDGTKPSSLICPWRRYDEWYWRSSFTSSTAKYRLREY